jgi:hypothetical protein
MQLRRERQEILIFSEEPTISKYHSTTKEIVISNLHGYGIVSHFQSIGATLNVYILDKFVISIWQAKIIGY